MIIKYGTYSFSTNISQMGDLELNHRLPDSHEIKGENEINFLEIVPNCEIYQRHTLLFVA